MRLAKGLRKHKRTAHLPTQPQLVIPRGKAVATIKTVIANISSPPPAKRWGGEITAHDFAFSRRDPPEVCLGSFAP